MGNCFRRRSAPPAPQTIETGPPVLYYEQPVIYEAPPVVYRAPPVVYEVPPVVYQAPPVVAQGPSSFGPEQLGPQQQPQTQSEVQWIQTTLTEAITLADRAVIGGYQGDASSPLWVIRAPFKGDLIPGKLDINSQAAYVPWDGKERPVENIAVCCAPLNIIRWVDSREGSIPSRAVRGGTTSTGEALYIGRGKVQGSLIPGKVHPSHESLFVSFGGREIRIKNNYQTMCYV